VPAVNWIEAKVLFTAENDDLTVELISDIFYRLGAKGVVVDDPHLQPVEGWGADALPLPTQPAVSGYLPDDARLEQQRLFFEDALAGLAGRHPFQYRIDYRRIAEEQWAESWKSFFHPLHLTAHLVVKPTWRVYAPQPGEHLIEIDPGMAFGTGTHPTTALCARLLERYLQAGDSLLDVGTGSGILLIAAARLGAGRMAGVDLDPLAVQIADRNLRLNAIPADQYELTCGHLVDTVNRSYDLVAANILADVIVRLLADIDRVLKPGGLFICSGVIADSRRAVADKIAASGLDPVETLEQDQWVAMAGRRRLR
jgi:ribosomal protein L11 methyltransferase